MKEDRICGQYRQGDVLIERVEVTGKEFQGKDLEPDERGRIVLARGEATGHDHTLRYSSLDNVIETDDEEIVFTATEPTSVVHQTHEPIPLNTGRHVATPQRQYTPQAIRRVAD